METKRDRKNEPNRKKTHRKTNFAIHSHEYSDATFRKEFALTIQRFTNLLQQSMWKRLSLSIFTLFHLVSSAYLFSYSWWKGRQVPFASSIHEHPLPICFWLKHFGMWIFPKIGNNDFETWLWLNVAMNKLIGWIFVFKFRGIQYHGMNRILCVNGNETKAKKKMCMRNVSAVWWRRRFYYCNRIGGDVSVRPNHLVFGFLRLHKSCAFSLVTVGSFFSSLSPLWTFSVWIHYNYVQRQSKTIMLQAKAFSTSYLMSLLTCDFVYTSRTNYKCMRIKWWLYTKGRI